MKKNILRHFRWKRDADKQGPREMAVVELSRGTARLGRFSRKGNGAVCESAVTFEELEEEKDNAAAFLDRILKEAPPPCQYLSVVLNRGNGIVRMLSFGEEFEADDSESQIRDSLGIDKEWAVSYQIIKNEKNAGNEENPVEKTDGKHTTVLAGALLENEVDALYNIVFDAGFIPVSLVTAGITLAGLAETASQQHIDGRGTGMLEISEQNSALVIVIDGQLKLVRQFDAGTYDFVNTIMKNYGLDKATAFKLLTSGSFDFSANIGDELTSWIRQLGISLNFIERKEGCGVEQVHLLERTEGLQTLENFFGEQLGVGCTSWELTDELPVLDSPSLDDRKVKSSFSLICAEAQRVMEREKQGGADV